MGIVTESKSIRMHSLAFVTHSGYGREKTKKGIREEGYEGTPLSNYAAPEEVDKKWQIKKNCQLLLIHLLVEIMIILN